MILLHCVLSLADHASFSCSTSSSSSSSWILIEKEIKKKKKKQTKERKKERCDKENNNNNNNDKCVPRKRLRYVDLKVCSDKGITYIWLLRARDKRSWKSKRNRSLSSSDNSNDRYTCEVIRLAFKRDRES